MNTYSTSSTPFDDSLWVRADNGWVGGVCQGLADSFQWNVNWVRLATVIGTICGIGLVLLGYLALWIGLPKRSRIAATKNARIFGVCARISDLSGTEVGLVRAIALILLPMTGGTAFLIYLVLAVFLPKPAPKPDNLVNS